jgi:Ca2+/Na+ antiporter
VRLLTGMVRANRPGRALLGLSKLLVGAFGTAAFALTTNTIWKMGDALGALRLTVIMLLGLTALVAWLIIAHDLWEKPDRRTPAELARMFNMGTILTLTLATALSYVALFVGTALAAALLIDTSVLEQTLQRPMAGTTSKNGNRAAG